MAASPSKGRSKSRETREDGFKALGENLEEYEQATQQQSADKFGINAVNLYREKQARLSDLKYNESLCAYEDMELTAIEDKISQIKQLQDARSALAELESTTDVPDAVFDHIDKLIARPGIATKLHDYLSKTSDLEIQSRKEKIGQFQATIETLEARNRETENHLEECRQCKRFISKYCFGTAKTLLVNFKNANTTLETVLSNITTADVTYAIQQVEPCMTGLSIHPPMTGFQLWVEALVRPQQFTTAKVLHCLKNAGDDGIKNVGFLKLAAMAILDGVTNETPLRGLAALAVLDILEIWFHLESEPSNTVRDLYDIFLVKRSISVVSKAVTSPIERIVECVSEMLGNVINPLPAPYERRGEKILSTFHKGAHKFIDMTTSTQRLVATSATTSRASPSIKLIPLDTSPRYFIYVEGSRIAWLKPEDITIRVDNDRDSWFSHDKLEPHLLAEREFPLSSEDLSPTFAILQGVTYID